MNVTAALREAPALAPMVDIVIPVGNEVGGLARSVRRLHTCLHLCVTAPAGTAGGSQSVTAWVTQNCRAVTISGTSGSLYDCSTAAGGSAS